MAARPGVERAAAGTPGVGGVGAGGGHVAIDLLKHIGERRADDGAHLPSPGHDDDAGERVERPYALKRIELARARRPGGGYDHIGPARAEHAYALFR